MKPPYKYITKVCQNPDCNKSFQAIFNDTKYCSHDCSNHVYNKKVSQQSAEKRAKAPKPTYLRKCRYCGLEAKTEKDLELFAPGIKPNCKYGRKNRCKACNYKIAHAEKLASKIPLDTVCEVCGSSKNLHRHHTNYRYPKQVVIVCSSCHRILHKIIDNRTPVLQAEVAAAIHPEGWN